MIWIVSRNALNSADELSKRHEYVREVTGAKTSDWQISYCNINSKDKTEYYKCKSYKGEYGIVITAHINEVIEILKCELSKKKRAYVVINSCALSEEIKATVIKLIKSINNNSEILFAQQEKYLHKDCVYDINPIDGVGFFGFETTKSERELFRNRNKGLIKAIRIAYDKV